MESGGAQAPPVDAYARWLAANANPAESSEASRQRVSALAYRPLVSVVIPIYEADPDFLAIALESVARQVYPDWEICIADDASRDARGAELVRERMQRDPRIRFTRRDARGHIAGATNSAIALARGEFLAFLDQDDELEPTALLEMVEALQLEPRADIVYSDHDIVDAAGSRRAPNLKPGWSPELLLSFMYFGHLKVYRTALVRQVGGLRAGFEGSADYDLALRMVEHTDRIRHVPRILYHWRALPSSMAHSADTKPESFEAGRRAVQEALERRGVAGSAIHPAFALGARVGMYHIDFRDTSAAAVTIIIPTRDRLDLLRDCVRSIEERTAHRAWQILIVDNESCEPATLEYFAATRHRVARCATPGGFNFAALVNFGVGLANTEFVVLLNNDTRVIAPEWLDEMMGYQRLPRVGAVGAKLLYADRRIQHAGVILGYHGLTGHALQPMPDSEAPLEWSRVARNFLGVTAACMMTRKSLFDEIGGFDERRLAVAWNDVDYCLRLHEAGYRAVMNPNATLYHLESQSRGDDKNPAEVAYMMSRWRRYIDDDPYFNAQYTRIDGLLELRTDPDEAKRYFYREVAS